jgi:hypothetical protein
LETIKVYWPNLDWKMTESAASYYSTVVDCKSRRIELHITHFNVSNIWTVALEEVSPNLCKRQSIATTWDKNLCTAIERLIMKTMNFIAHLSRIMPTSPILKASLEFNAEQNKELA